MHARRRQISSPRLHRKVVTTRRQNRRSAPPRTDGRFPAQRPTARTFGYARVSTEEQNLDLQLTALRNDGVADECLFVEKISAVNAKRHQFNLLMKMLETGDRLVFHAISRIGREVPQILAILKGLSDEGITWRSLTEPYLDATTASGRLMVNITSAMAQFERDQIKDRTKRGMDELRRQGMYLGRPEIVSRADVKQMLAMRKRKVQVTRIAKQYGIKPSTVYARTNALARGNK